MGKRGDSEEKKEGEKVERRLEEGSGDEKKWKRW